MPVLPGGTIGILGGGQLGRMLALAARPLGYRVHVLDPDAGCAAAPIVERVIAASFDDAAAAESLARACDVITLEIEKIGLAAMAAATRHAPVRPGQAVLDVIQDRARQKRWLDEHHFPLTPWHLVTSAAELGAAHTALGDGAFLKAAHGGYDGRGQGRLRHGEDTAALWRAIGGVPSVVERAVDLECELSVLVARRPGGEEAIYPPAFNHHDNHILTWSVLPAPVPADVSARAQQLAGDIAAALGLEGVLVVELFVTRAGEVLVNELAPRVHNSYHESELACVTSQFEQAIRAVCDLPLGSTEITRPAAIYNLLGDLWQGGKTPDFARALRVPGVTLRLYGKGDPRPARKMGHLTASAPTVEAAVARAREAYAELGGGIVSR
jgi:5-(carboxyamino)imidazole ribonucleotide synthase